jgi:hypothetical protein
MRFNVHIASLTPRQHALYALLSGVARRRLGPGRRLHRGLIAAVHLSPALALLESAETLPCCVAQGVVMVVIPTISSALQLIVLRHELANDVQPQLSRAINAASVQDGKIIQQRIGVV